MLNVATTESSDSLLTLDVTLPDGESDLRNLTVQDRNDLPIKTDETEPASSPYLIISHSCKCC
jgi:hypothetical protein